MAIAGSSDETVLAAREKVGMGHKIALNLIDEGKPIYKYGVAIGMAIHRIGLREVLVSRAASPSAVKQLAATYDKAASYCKAVRQYSVAPGNFAGGLTTIEEKSMGAFAKSGRKPIEGVLRVSEASPHLGSGFWIPCRIRISCNSVTPTRTTPKESWI